MLKISKLCKKIKIIGFFTNHLDIYFKITLNSMTTLQTLLLFILILAIFASLLPKRKFQQYFETLKIAFDFVISVIKFWKK